MRRARVPLSAEPFSQLHAHARMTHQIANISRLHAVLCHDPKLSADASVTNWSAVRLPGLATDRLKECIAWRRHTHGKEEHNRRIEDVFLKRVNKSVFHSSRLSRCQFTLFTAQIFGN